MIQNPNFKNFNSEVLNQDIVKYTEKDHATWKHLYTTQLDNLQDLAHPKILKCLAELSLPENNVPQLEEVSDKLYKQTGWQVARVEDLIDSHKFFNLLANRTFPSTVYIRSNEELTLSRDPDIFHELFGHCPVLLDIAHANLFEKFGLLGLQLDEVQRQFFQRLFWFTFETGLIRTPNGLKIYGGSLLSSIKESRYSIQDAQAIRKPFEMVQVLRTPYRADLLQGVYYIIINFSQIYSLLDNIDLIKAKIDEAYALGEFSPAFPVEEQYAKYINYNLSKPTNYKEQDRRVRA